MVCMMEDYVYMMSIIQDLIYMLSMMEEYNSLHMKIYISKSKGSIMNCSMVYIRRIGSSMFSSNQGVIYFSKQISSMEEVRFYL